MIWRTTCCPYSFYWGEYLTKASKNNKTDGPYFGIFGAQNMLQIMLRVSNPEKFTWLEMLSGSWTYIIKHLADILNDTSDADPSMYLDYICK